MTADCLKLTAYFGERDRAGDRFLADAVLDLCERHAFATSVLLRGAEGFGISHRLQTQRLLSLSEDLPIVAVAVDTRERVEAALPELMALAGHGLITLERARLVTGTLDSVPLAGEVKLTAYVGRHERAAGRPAHLAVVDLLHRHGVAGATVLLGVDGTAHGARHRARLVGANVRVPVMVISVGDGDRIAGVLPALGALLERPLLTLERVRICKRDGAELRAPVSPPPADASGLGVWQKLMVYGGEQNRSAGRPQHVELVRRLRAAGAAGATVLRGVWGYHGDHAPHGDRLLALARRVPVVTVVVDVPERAREWYAIVDEVTAHAGLVTSELVPALRATGPGVERGGLRLADP